MKLKEWAREQGVSYRAALNWFHAGTLPSPAPARRLDTGTILVEPSATESERTVAYCRVSSADQRDDPTGLPVGSRRNAPGRASPWTAQSPKSAPG